MSRLKKVALMNPEMFKGTLKQLSTKGRTILKGIEDYKFALEQAARIVANDPNLGQRLVEKKKELDKAAGEIYSIVFEIENIDITKEFQQQQFVNNPALKNQVNNDGENTPSLPNKPTGPVGIPPNSTSGVPSQNGGGNPTISDEEPEKPENPKPEEEEKPKEEEKNEEEK
jgi:hypothetical protein